MGLVYGRLHILWTRVNVTQPDAIVLRISSPYQIGYAYCILMAKALAFLVGNCIRQGSGCDLQTGYGQEIIALKTLPLFKSSHCVVVCQCSKVQTTGPHGLDDLRDRVFSVTMAAVNV